MKFMERMRLRARTRAVEGWIEARRYCTVQHDFDIADGPGASVRGDLNDSLEALVTWNSGASDPATTFPRMRVVQTTAGVVKRRNAANSAWIVESTDDETLVVSRSSDTILDVSDIGKTIVATAGFTQTFDAAATLTGSWWCRYRIESGATIVFDANGAELIDGAATKSVVGPSSGFIVCNASGLKTIGFSVSVEAYIYIRDEKASGTNGGTSAATTQTRVLNTEVVDTGGNATLASNQITLAAGTYRVRARAPAYRPGGHRIRLRNVTAGTTIALGSSAFGDIAASQDSTDSFLTGRFTVAASQALELQHFMVDGELTVGLGVAASSGEAEVYAEIEFWKEPA